jgi:hypothetical protein
MAYSEDLQGTTTTNKHTMHVGGVGNDEYSAIDEVRKVFEDKGMSDNIIDSGSGATFSVDLTKPTEMVNYYEALVESMRKMEAEGLEESDTYREISEQVAALGENYEEAKIQADEFIKSLATDFDSNLVKENATFSNVKTFSDYYNKRQTMIDELVKLEGVTEKEAEQIIANSETFKDLEAAKTLSEILILMLTFLFTPTNSKMLVLTLYLK